MKKVVFSLIICFVTTVASYSQIKVGIRGGANFNNVKILQQPDDYLMSFDRGVGLHIGLTGQVQLFRLYVQPELILSTISNGVTLEGIQQNGYQEVGNQRFNKLDIPIYGGLKFDNNFKIGIGPVFSYVLSQKTSLESGYELYRTKATVGYQMGAGFDYDRFNIELRYEGNLSKLGAGVKIGDSVYNFDNRISQLILTMAIYL